MNKLSKLQTCDAVTLISSVFWAKLEMGEDGRGCVQEHFVHGREKKKPLHPEVIIHRAYSTITYLK